MPRGVRKKTDYGEQIKKIEERINRLKKSITELEMKKAEMQNLKEQDELKRLNDLIKQAGSSPEELINAIVSHSVEHAS
jgi:TolA-binding protein